MGRGPHGLRAACKVYNREPAVAEGETVAKEQSFTVWASMGQRVSHPSEHGFVVRGRGGEEAAGDAAHGYSFAPAAGAGLSTERTR